MHCADVYRGMRHQKIISNHHDTLEMYGKGKAFSKNVLERILRLMVQCDYVREDCERNSTGFISAYIKVYYEKRVVKSSY